MQKFVPRNRIRIFGNKRTRSTPLDPKLMFWCITLYLGAFANVSLLHETRYKMGWTGATNAEVRAKKSHQNFSQRTHSSTPLEPNSCSGAFRSVSVHLTMFRYYTELGANWVELVQLMKKFVPRNHIRVFRNERTRSAPLDAKLMNWCVS